MRRQISHAAIFVILLGMSLAIPLMIEAILPGGAAGAPPPPEVPVESPRPASHATESARVRENYAWLQGETGTVLDASDGADDTLAAAEQALAESDDEEAPLDLRPGLYLAATRSWDTLETRREQFTAGGFFFISSHTRLMASGARLRLRDDLDKIYGTAVRLDGAHRLPGEWILEEGVERTAYDGLHDSWNGDARLSGALSPRVGIAVEGGRRDVWERLANVRDKLRLWQVGLSLFYEMLPRIWLAAFGNAGWFSDHNARLITGVEAGYALSPRAGLSAAVGVETTAFRDQEVTYWSPSYYHYVYGRLRLTRDYETAPFERARAPGGGWRDRLGYLAEVTAGVNDDGNPEASGRAGLAVRATDRLTFRAEYFHLDSEGRFDASYSENRVDASAEVRF